MQDETKYYNTDGTLKGFLKAYKCIPACFACKFENELRELLFWPKSTYEAKKRGIRKLNDIERPVVIETLKKYGIDFNTGDNIFYK